MYETVSCLSRRYHHSFPRVSSPECEADVK